MSAGVPVWALRRSEDALAALQKSGVRTLAADLLQPSTLKNIPPVRTVVYCQAPSRRTDDYQRTYVEGARNLSRALEKSGVTKAVLVSSTGVYAVSDGSIIDESTSTGTPTPRSAALLEAERTVLGGPVPAVVLRLAGIYGPGRNALTRASAGRPRPEGFTNRIHVEDAVSCIGLLAEHGKAGEIYLGSDDEPCTAADFYAWLAPRLPAGHPAVAALPVTGPSADKGKRCSNRKIKGLGLELKYPTYREGYSEILGREGAGAR